MDRQLTCDTFNYLGSVDSCSSRNSEPVKYNHQKELTPRYTLNNAN